MCLYFCSALTMDQTFFCYVCIVYVWSWSSAPFVSELCVRRTSDESRHSRAISAMYHSLRSENRHQDVMSCYWKQFQLWSGLIFLQFFVQKKDPFENSFCWNNLNERAETSIPNISMQIIKKAWNRDLFIENQLVQKRKSWFDATLPRLVVDMICLDRSGCSLQARPVLSTLIVPSLSVPNVPILYPFCTLLVPYLYPPCTHHTPFLYFSQCKGTSWQERL